MWYQQLTIYLLRLISEMWIIYALFASSIANNDIRLNKKSGTAFVQSAKSLSFFFDSPRVTINLRRPAPRMLLDSRNYEECNKILKHSATNAFGSQGHCDVLFDNFDRQINGFLETKLISKMADTPRCFGDAPYPYYNGLRCCSLPTCDKKPLTIKSRCCDGIPRLCEDPPCAPHQTANKKYFDSTKTDYIETWKLIDLPEPRGPRTDSHRHSRSPIVPIVGAMVLIVTSISAYFLGETLAEEDLQQLHEEISIQQSAIKHLKSAVELQEQTLNEVVKTLKVNPNTVLQSTSEIQTGIQHQSELLRNHANFFDINQLTHIERITNSEAKLFESFVLQLSNNRLPLQKTFLLALRAKCISLQQHNDSQTRSFCLNFAYRCTRWTNPIKFVGIGFESYFRSSSRSEPTAWKRTIRSTIYSFAVNIPILTQKTGVKYSTTNLGRFQKDVKIHQLSLPVNLVLTSGYVYPLDTSRCLQFGLSEICPSTAISTFSPCLNSVFSGRIHPTCKATEKYLPQTCIGRPISQNLMLVSLFGNGTVHPTVDHNFESDIPQIQDFGVVERKPYQTQLFCKKSPFAHIPPKLTIPAVDKTLTANYTVTEVKGDEISKIPQPVNIWMKSIESTLDAAQKQINATRTDFHRINSAHKNTLTEVENKWHNSISSLAGKIQDEVVNIGKKILLPILCPLLILVGWLLFDSLRSCKIKSSQPQSPNADPGVM